MTYNPFSVFAWDMQRHINIMARKTDKRAYMDQIQKLCTCITLMSVDTTLPAEQYVPIVAELRELLDRHVAIDPGSFAFVRRGKHRIEAFERAIGVYRFDRSDQNDSDDAW